MSNDSDKPNPQEPMPDNQQILNEFESIEEKLNKGFEEDPRLSSGVPEEHRGSDTEFIQMSGLVPPAQPTPPREPIASDTDIDAAQPVSFYEKGVADVDATMTPGNPGDEETPPPPFVTPLETSRAAMAHLREIIADLTKEPPTVPTDPALMAQLESSGVLPPVPGDEEPEALPVQERVEDIAPDQPADVAPPTPPEALEPASGEEQPPTETAPPQEPPVRHAPVLPHHAAHLEKAEKLLEELESDHDLSSLRETATAEETAPGAAPHEIQDQMLDFKPQSKRRHRTPKKHPILESLARLFMALLFITALLVVAYVGYGWLNQRMSAPSQLFKQAARLASQGEYAESSRLYQKFAKQYPADTLRPEAQFAAAFTLQLQRPSDNDKRVAIAQESIRLFETFRRDNPTHPKVARAETLMGRLSYESGQYQQAIELLRNPELRLRDPASTVPALRTLARASAKIGDPEAARSYYLQSAGSQDNHSPDVDYAELGSLYQSLADRTPDLDKRIRLQQLAIESWTHALEVPGIDPSNKQAIRTQLDVLRERLQNEPGMAPAMEALDVSPETTVSAEAATAAPLEPIGATQEPAAEAPAVPLPDTAPAMTDAADSDYVVQPGDTLQSIADAHSTTVQELVSLNALTSESVREGQHLIVPAVPQP